MKALFVHDHWFSVAPSGAVYSSGKLPYNTWQRYLMEFDELIVVGRSNVVSDVQASKMNLSSGERVTFAFVPNLAGSCTFFLYISRVLNVIAKQINTVDAVIARSSLLGQIAVLLARKAGKPCAIEVVGDAWDAYWNYGNIVSKIFAPISWWAMRHCLRNAEFAIYVTQDYLQRRYPCRGLCCWASDVEIETVEKDVLEEKISRWRCHEKNHQSRLMKIGMIGSIAHRYKGLHVALRALRRFKHYGIAIEFHVLGDGNHDHWINEAESLGIAHFLHLDGILPSGRPVIQWLDRLDIYIQPSFQEGLPRALIEAMSRGLPALGSTCGGIPELLPPECLHRPGDDKTLADQLERMIQDSAWLILQAERNFHEASRYDTERMFAQRTVFWKQFAEAVRRGGKSALSSRKTSQPSSFRRFSWNDKR